MGGNHVGFPALSRGMSAVVRYSPTPRLVPLSLDCEPGLRWDPFAALGVTQFHWTTIARMQDRALLETFQRHVTNAYHIISRRLRGKAAHQWLRS